jgi:uncharacterized protein (TIGR02270 family)
MTGSPAGVGDTADALILWDVVEEHLDEAEFGVVQFRRMLEHPSLTLPELDKWQERLAAHIDGLVVGGPVVIQRLVVPALEEARAPERVTAGSLALLESGELSQFHNLLGHPQEQMRQAAAWACALTNVGERVAQGALQTLHAAASAYEQAGLLDVIASRGIGAPGVTEILRDSDPVILPAALRAAPFCQGPGLLRAIESHLGSSNPVVLEAAIFAALAHQSPLGLEALESHASTAQLGSKSLLALLAALGGPNQHAIIAHLAGSGTHESAALFALGYSGNLTHAPLLLERLRDEDATRAKIAAQSLSMLFDLDLARFQLPPRRANDPGKLPRPTEDLEAIEALPPFDEDDLDELPLPEPEDDLPTLDPGAIESEVARISAVMQPGKRHLGGHLYSRGQLLDLLARTPLRRRHTLAQVLFIDTGRQCHVDTRAGIERQRHQLARAAQQVSASRHRYPIW